MDMQTLEWLLLATGFMGAWTLSFLFRTLLRRWRAPLAVTAHFANKNAIDTVIQQVKQARQEVLLLASAFTSKAVAQALVDAKARGLHVDILIDPPTDKAAGAELKGLLGDGLTPLVDGEHGEVVGNVLILDGQTILTGSFRYLEPGEADHVEDLVLIEGNTELARSYRQFFLEHKAHSKPSQRKPLGGAKDDKQAA